jgi:hypothetical protein
LTTTQVAKLLSSGRSWMHDGRGEVPANVNCYHGGRLCCLRNVVAPPVGLAPLSLRGAKRRSNLEGEPGEIAMPRQVGARNDKRGPRLINQAAIETLRRDLQMRVSSLFLAPVAQTSSGFSCRSIYPAGAGRGWLGLTNRTTISAREAFSTGRVPVGYGQ